jgi:hypothetical protein
MNNHRCREDQKCQINILENTFGNIIPISLVGTGKKFLLYGKIYTKDELIKNNNFLQELEIINIFDRIPDLDCESYDNGWYFPITLKYQKISGGSQNLSVEDIILTMKQAPQINPIKPIVKTCLIVYAAGDFYTKLRFRYKNSELYKDEFPRKFNIRQYLEVVAKHLNIKCKILCDDNYPKDKASLYDICIKGIYE